MGIFHKCWIGEVDWPQRAERRIAKGRSQSGLSYRSTNIFLSKRSFVAAILICYLQLC